MKKIFVLFILTGLITKVFICGSGINLNGRMLEVNREIGTIEKENLVLEKEVARLYSVAKLSEEIKSGYQPVAVLSNTEKGKGLTYNIAH